MKKIALYSFTAISLLLTTGCSDEAEDQKPKSPIHGEWRIVEASKDDEDQATWKNKIITFSEEGTDNGTYTFSSTIDETIWKTSGHWTTADVSGAKVLTIDETLQITYVITDLDSTLTMQFVLYGNGDQDGDGECDNPFCPAIILGNWNFKLKRSSAF